MSETFFRSKWVTPPEGWVENDPAELASGFQAAGIPCGLKADGKTDLGLIHCAVDEVTSAILLTRNAAAAAPIRVCRDQLEQHSIRSCVINSGNANAATGEQGIRDALEFRGAVAERLGLEAETVAVAETGVIGVPLDMDAIRSGFDGLVENLATDGGVEFCKAIMTTDKGPKQCSVTVDGVTVSAQAKGAGMIEPGFATMLCFVQTDAIVEDAEGQLRRAAADSFERITVDGQMSTNDTILFQSSGLSGKPMPAGLLEAVLLQLAIEVVADGEGATRVGRVVVEGAADDEEADMVARKIANSPLVKTALLGRDPNWGRIAQAAGMALAGDDIGELGPDVIEAEDLAGEAAEAEIGLRLDRGTGTGHIYFSDLTHEYIVINAEYTT